MIRPELKLRPHPEVVDTELEGHETVLLHLQSKLYFSLNPTGTRIWQGLKEQLTLVQISERLQREFDVERERADQSVLALVDELYKQRLIEREDYS